MPRDSDAQVTALAPRRAAAELRQRTDDELMLLAAAGRLEAFSELTRRHEGPVRAFCAQMLGSRAQGDDVAQEVFLDIWRSCGRYDAQGRFRGLLFAVARNRCLKDLRARPTTASVPGATDFDETRVAAPGDAVDVFLEAERRRRLDRLVDQLPAKLRDAIRLRFSAELEYAEIAEIVRRPEATVRSRVFQGLKRLRQRLDALKEGSSP